MAAANSVFQSVESILTAIIADLQSGGSPITDFTIGSGARTLCEAASVAVSQGTLAADQLQLDGHLDTATGAALDALAGNDFVTRLPGAQAQGQITITRQSTTDALTVVAGWAQLTTTPSIPGQSGVAVLTTQDAVFPVGTASVTVNAQATVPALAGSLAAGTYLTPLAPVNTISNQNGYQVTTAFTGGADVETDDAFRARIPLTVQGRIPGRKVSFLAAALGVPGVIGANVLQAGDSRGDGTTVAGGSVEVYYRGGASLLVAVTSAVNNAAMLSQNAATFTAAAAECKASITVYVDAGTDTGEVQSACQTAVLNYFAGLSVGQQAQYSEVVHLLLQVPAVVDVGLPMAQFSLLSAASGVAGNIAALPTQYLDMQLANLTVTVTVLS